MRKIFIPALLAVLMLPGVNLAAQDSRNRAASTIVADALAQLPATRQNNYNNLMGEIAGTGTEGVLQLASMLVPADKGQNNLVEYALSGVVSYVGADANNPQRAAVRKGLIEAVEKCTDDPNRAFLLTLLQRISAPEDAKVFEKYLNDDYLRQTAINGLSTVPDGGAALLAAMKNGLAPRADLARVAGYVGLKDAEPILLAWIPGADGKTLDAIYYALGRVGTSKSLPALMKAAKASNFEWRNDNNATEGLLTLLNNMAANGEGVLAAKTAKTLVKNDKDYVSSSAMRVISKVNGRASMPQLLEAMKNPSRATRFDALRNCEPWADETVYTKLGEIVNSKKPSPAKSDIVNWFGANHVSSQIGTVNAAMNSTDSELAKAAIRAAGRIGGDEALNALIPQLAGEHSKEAAAALLAFNGKVNPGIVKALDNEAVQIPALGIAAKRRMTEAAPKVFSLLNSGNKEVSDAAYAALPGVVTTSDFDRLSKIIEKDGGKHTADLQAALKSSVRNLPADAQYKMVNSKLTSSSDASLYYPSLAQVGNSEAIATLAKGYEKGNRQAAFDALLTVDNLEMLDILYDIAVKDQAHSAPALDRYNKLISRSDFNNVRRYQLYRKGLEAANDVHVKNRLIEALARTQTYPALLVVENYTTDPGNQEYAAEAIRTIVSKNPDFGGAAVSEALDKAAAAFQAVGTADAGYALDDVKGMKSRMPENGYTDVLASKPALKAVAMNPEAAKAAKNAAKKKAETAATAAAKAWSNNNGILSYNGTERSVVALPGDYENFEMMFEWKGNGAVGVRSMEQINLGGEASGVLSANANNGIEHKGAVNPAGEWNTTYIKVNNDRITVIENGETVMNNETMANPYKEGQPAYSTGEILFIGEGQPLEVRELFIREQPSTPVTELSAEEAADGFELLFDGRSMHKWTGNKVNYTPVDGTIYVNAQYGSGGNLYTVDEFSDFILRFEFMFEKEGVNNGIGIRTPMGVDAAYHGMEIQVLDHDAPIYKGLRPYQVHGSVYGIIPAKRVVFPGLGVWNTEEIRAVGDHITVTVNGEVILDGNIREATQGHNVAPEGEKSNPYTVDHLNHPGLFNKSGHVGFLGHGSGIKFRNVRIKDLSK
ncbi:MAG: DUF1080 domain-containing protein [Muribaculaceae bacterium]|nr:DUF1080 domain-containing protein [Muribaculaceae bacterium]